MYNLGAQNEWVTSATISWTDLSILMAGKTRLVWCLREAEARKAGCNYVEAGVVRRGRGQVGEQLADFKEMAWP